MAQPDIFLSYNREDAARAKQFAEGLTAEGFNVWWDATLRSGEAYDEVTEAALSDAKAVVVLWSPRSVGSRWVRAEATEADRAKKLVPAMIEACKRPIMFELVQTAELSHWKGDRKDSAWRAFVEDLRGFASKSPPAAQAAIPNETPVGTGLALSRGTLWAALAVVALAVAAVFYFTLGSGDGAGIPASAEDRVPVLVRAFAASSSGNSEEAALASGITDELIDRLRRIPELQIATARADGSAPSEAFEGAHVVEGNIRSSGDQLKVTARLLKPDGEVLWSQTFDRKLVDLFDVQEQIAKALADALSVPLDVGANSAAYGGTNNPEAYAAYMQYFAHQYDPDQTVPQRYLERAVAIDPHFVKGLVGLSQNYSGRGGNVATDAEAEAMLKAMDDSSQRALDADPDLALGPMVRGWYFLMRRDVVEADKMIARATKLDDGTDPELRNSLAIYWIYTGRVKKGAALRQSNELIDPIYRNDPWKIFDYTILGRHREAIDLYAKLKRSEQNLQGFSFHAYYSYLLLGDEQTAREFAEQEKIPLDGQFTAALSTMGDAELLQWVGGRAPGQAPQVVAAVEVAYSGRDRLAMQILQQAFDRPGVQSMLVLWHPVFARLRKTPEFEQLVTDLGLVKAWRESGDWGDYCKPEAGGGISCI